MESSRRGTEKYQTDLELGYLKRVFFPKAPKDSSGKQKRGNTGGIFRGIFFRGLSRSRGCHDRTPSIGVGRS